MDLQTAKTLFAYNTWANRRVLDAAAELTPEQLTAPSAASHGSLMGALAHVLAAEWVWRLRCQEGLSPGNLPTAADFPSLEPLQERMEEEASLWRDYLETLSEDDLARFVHYKNTRGVEFETPLWQVIAHVVNHGTQFRSEAALLLTQLGHSPGDLDLIAYLRA